VLMMILLRPTATPAATGWVLAPAPGGGLAGLVTRF